MDVNVNGKDHYLGFMGHMLIMELFLVNLHILQKANFKNCHLPEFMC